VIRPAEAEDAPAIAALEREALGSDAWSERLVAEGAAGRVPTTRYLVATDAEGLAGYTATSIVDVAELQRIAVAPTRRRTGVATDLLARVEDDARAGEVDRLMLEVREDNHGACAFYAARGFREVDRRPRYYADGTTAVILVKDLA
jgi:[ribosomal protein S18]-alanine N-acetyltransferase